MMMGEGGGGVRIGLGGHDQGENSVLKRPISAEWRCARVLLPEQT